jgi:hypothetical protein
MYISADTYLYTVYIYIYILYQPPLFEFDPSTTQDLRRRTEIIPVKDSHTRINCSHA